MVLHKRDHALVKFFTDFQRFKMRFIFCISILLLSINPIWIEAQTNFSSDLMELSKTAIEKSPVLKRNAYTITNAEADLQIQSSVFDYNLFSNLSYQKSRYHLFESDPRNQYLDKILNSNNIDISAGLNRKFRTGQIVELGLQHLFNSNNIPFNNFSQPIPTFRGDYTSLLNLSITQPLLRGRGKSIVTLNEQASKLFIESAKENNEFITSLEILRVGEAYWNYFTAFKLLNIYKLNERRVEDVLYMTEELVKADKKPAGDLAQINADLANQKKFTIIAIQNYFNAKQNLGRVIGLTDSESELLADPVDDYPNVDESGYNQLLNKENLINTGITNRKDFVANEKILEALKLYQRLAENNLKPQLDLTGFGFYGNASQGNGKPFQVNFLFKDEGNYVGAGAKLTFSFPINNNYAKGNLAKSNAAISDQLVQNDNLKRNIELNITIALNNLENTIRALEQSELALNSYRQAYENEQLKFKTGLTTLLNVILFQERLTSAEIEYLKSQQSFASAIINLRHETGTLIEYSNNGYLVRKENYFTIPQ